MGLVKFLSRKITWKWSHPFVFRMVSKDVKSGGTPKKVDEFPNANRWRRIFAYGCIPLIALCAINVVLNFKPQRPEFVPYEHMRLRTRKYPWGDGNHTLFHNKRLNALPGGFEEQPQNAQKEEEEE